MARWIPPDWEEKEMLSEMGLTSVEELFKDIPRKVRLGKIGLPPSLDEREVVSSIQQELSRNKTLDDFDSFLGGGYYHRYLPAVVDGILQRSEFYTSYTPYQPEASQGILQSLFEFQSLWVELTNMDVANASLYDGATAMGEAVLMASRVRMGKRFLVPGSLNWEKRSVLENYTRGANIDLVSIPWDSSTGLVDLDFIEREAKNDVAGVVVEMPDSLGLLDERFPQIKSRIGDAQLIVSADPLSLSLIEPPGSWGADIVVGEGQGFGIPLSYGGPLLGLMACRKSSVRQLPGRLVGATKDTEGRRAFTLTLQTREQHIRRSRATSNVCTNHSLMALAFLSYATTLGPSGLKRLATCLTEKVHDLARSLANVRGLKVPGFGAPYLFDLAVGVEGMDVEAFLNAMFKRKILAGTSLSDPRPKAQPSPFHGYLASVGQETDRKAIDRYVKQATSVLEGKG